MSFFNVMTLLCIPQLSNIPLARTSMTLIGFKTKCSAASTRPGCFWELHWNSLFDFEYIISWKKVSHQMENTGCSCSFTFSLNKNQFRFLSMFCYLIGRNSKSNGFSYLDIANFQLWIFFSKEKKSSYSNEEEPSERPEVFGIS